MCVENFFVVWVVAGLFVFWVGFCGLLVFWVLLGVCLGVLSMLV